MKISQITLTVKNKKDEIVKKAKAVTLHKSKKTQQKKELKTTDIYAMLRTTGIVLYLYRFILFYPLAIIYLEVVFKLTVLETFFNSGLLYMLLFSIPAGLLLYIISTPTKRKSNRIISIIITSVITLIYMVQVVYHKVFTAFFALFSLNGAGQVLQFWREILSAIYGSLIPLLFLLVPLLFIIFLGNRLLPPDKSALSFKGVLAVAVVILQLVATLSVHFSDEGELSPSFIYSKAIIPELSVDKFGLITTTRLDLKHLIFGFESEGDFGEPGNEEYANVENEGLEKNNGEFGKNENTAKEKSVLSSPAGESSETGSTHQGNITGNAIEVISQEPQYNIMDIDFDKLIAAETNEDIKAMHSYFKRVEPTKKNDYTGRYKGKNLIFITAEGFSPYAVREDVTPTLYKLSQEGFQFTNFYTPIWGVSTSDGEYVACNSLVPKSGVWSFYVSGKNYMPFVMGNQLKKLGYEPMAYHNHSYTYYNRNVSHPNMGYDFKAVGHGLDVQKTWPESDLEMIQKTTEEYIDKKPFHAYYMTVSGHLQYNFGGNYIARKNKELVKDLPYSEHVRAYLACQIELDKAIEELISRLEAAGVAEDTLIAISPDHYPYGLTVDEIEELAGHKIEENFELYKGVFLLWSKGMKPEKIEKPCGSMDILPTLSNLMGVEYDSRLLMGRDIMSDAPPLVIFSNWSWLTDKAKYNSKQRKLILEEGETEETVTKEYKASIAKEVNNKFTYSTKILDKNYYAKLLK